MHSEIYSQVDFAKTLRGGSGKRVSFKRELGKERWAETIGKNLLLDSSGTEAVRLTRQRGTPLIMDAPPVYFSTFKCSVEKYNNGYLGIGDVVRLRRKDLEHEDEFMGSQNRRNLETRVGSIRSYFNETQMEALVALPGSRRKIYRHSLNLNEREAMRMTLF